MRRSRVTGRSKPKDTEFGWYFAGEPMEKRHSRSGRIRLVRYGPEREICVHSRCPSPSPIPENAPCTCGNRCKVHPHGTRSPSPSNTDSSLYGAIRCCGGCHAIRRERESSPQVEKLICTCNHRCACHSPETRTVTPSASEYSSSETATRRHVSRHSSRRERRSNDARPTTPNSSDFSDYDPSRRRRTGHRTTKRQPEHHPQVEECQCEAHIPPPNTPAGPSQRYKSPRALIATAPRPSPVVHRHHCCKASYCESHPEGCRATMPRPTPTPTRSPRSSDKPRHSLREKSDPKYTYRRSASPPKQMPPMKPVTSPKPTSPRPDVHHCTCFHMDEYHADDSGYYDDTVSETSIQAMPDHDRDVDESFCVYHHRCRPRFECGLGWVCGRK
ncbi:hypothetical protein N7447_001976 [Penicillium robsamsonii]|uniref:uncharacterized protein n=1 Tax=Penicillium robsamsonii TaxID=1792511 RepID=UPI002547D3E6|nr:uncharacterized protein N7447_001976 [Penicillium robsamsonii]KAJ5835950.1 hypothetical protein N7447_001976 [Penicillium robsamsonii]